MGPPLKALNASCRILPSSSTFFGGMACCKCASEALMQNLVGDTSWILVDGQGLNGDTTRYDLTGFCRL